MPNSQKPIIDMLFKYAEMLHGQLREMDYRLRVFEAVMEKDPQLLLSYNQALRRREET